MKAVAGYCVACLLGALAIFAWLDAQHARGRASVAEQRASIALARYAEEATKAKPVAETVRVRVASVRTVRESLLVNLTDTLLVKEYVRTTDTLVIACLACAARLDSLRLVSDSVIAAKDEVITSLRPSRWEKVKAPLAFVAGAVLGAYLRGQ